ncbi:MAG TPA: twin-arginine translocation (Tat) [Bradyrhizobium sp.]|nr:twin-arginine translocation (Tat) [Bradyrhizobium sp.]
MERRDFLKFTLGFVAGGAALAASAQAAPLPPMSGDVKWPGGADVEPAVVSQDDVDRIKPEEVRWHHGWRRHWHRRHWGWRRRHWHHRHW